MSKLFIALSILGAGALSTVSAVRSARHAQEMGSSQRAQWQAASNHVNKLNETLLSLRNEVAEKKKQLTSSHRRSRPELLKLLEARTPDQAFAVRAELREQLGLRWDNSPDYVLVSKSVLKKIGLESLGFDGKVTDEAAAILAISPEERSQIDATVKQLTADSATRIMGRMQRIDPAGDIVAHYSITPDPTLENAVSNLFSVRIAGVLGAERGELFVEPGWRALKASFPVTDQEPETLTIRRAVVNGQPELSWHAVQGTSRRSGPIRYGHYPTRWFLKLFPGGWKDLAEREGFELPKDWKPQ